MLLLHSLFRFFATYLFSVDARSTRYHLNIKMTLHSFWTTHLDEMELKYSCLPQDLTEWDLQEYIDHIADVRSSTSITTGESDTYSATDTSDTADSLIDEEMSRIDRIDTPVVFLQIHNIEYLGLESIDFLQLNGFTVRIQDEEATRYYNLLDIIQAIHVRIKEQRRLTRKECYGILRAWKQYEIITQTKQMKIPGVVKHITYISKKGVQHLAEHLPITKTVHNILFSIYVIMSFSDFLF
jgi:hypothetical protein